MFETLVEKCNKTVYNEVNRFSLFYDHLLLIKMGNCETQRSIQLNRYPIIYLITKQER